MKIIVGIASRNKNPLLERCMKSIDTVEAGVAYELKVELGELFTRGEKRQRIFQYAKEHHAQLVCILEDDTEIIDEAWLWKMVATCSMGQSIGIVMPMEARYGSDAPMNPKEMHGAIIEVPNAFGFCMLYNMSWSPLYDPRISYLDDFAMSMQCRAAGYRIVLSGLTTVRHTKQPFHSDDTPPWAQADRERWGKDSIYYNADKFFERRVWESELLIKMYGDMATDSLPHDLKRAIAEKHEKPSVNN